MKTRKLLFLSKQHRTEIYEREMSFISCLEDTQLRIDIAGVGRDFDGKNRKVFTHPVVGGIYVKQKV